MALLDLVPQQTVQLVITLHPNGALSVQGPVHEKEFCIAMLEQAKDAVRNSQAPASKLVIPSKDVQLS